MTARKKWLKLAIVAGVLLAALQFAAGVVVRTHRGHAYLVARLERAFGRTVEVGQFDAGIFPSPRLDAMGVTVGESPAFGNEYFLRAEKLSAGLRWSTLLRGHFDFGALSLSHPSLILVRSLQGRWNLEEWLPPAKTSEAGGGRIYGPPTAFGVANRLQRIEFDDGRVNFKNAQDKLPFAFIAVNGAVEQVSAGRWQLQLEAQPWRSGVALQSAGTLHVLGDLAGTSARLQPAHLEVHWTNASVADLLRLLRGQDYGVRGSFALDAIAQSGDPNGARAAMMQQASTSLTNPATTPVADQASRGNSSAHPVTSTVQFSESPTDWTFSLQARIARIHSWDLTERADAPRLSLRLRGRGNIASRALDISELALESPASNLRGTFHYANATPELRVDSAGIQAADVLAWWRAFESGLADKLTAEGFFTASVAARGWPLQFDQFAFSSEGGTARIPGLSDPILIGPVHGGGDRRKLTLDPVRLQLGGDRATLRRHAAAPLHDAGDLSASEDFSTHQGGITVEAQLDQISTVFRAAAAIGRPLEHGWDVNGHAQGFVEWDWNLPRGQRWSGKAVISKARIAVAGLNQQLQVDNAAYVWDHGKHSVLLGAATGFGTTWSGSLHENRASDDPSQPHWNFSLHGGELDAAEVDRWVGPRARPGWLRTLLASLAGSPAKGSPQSGPSTTDIAALDDATANVNVSDAVSGTAASELLRRLDAEGDLTFDHLSIENLAFDNVHAVARLRNLQLEAPDVSALWAGGRVHGKLTAKFSPRPAYDIAAQFDAASLAQLPHLPELSGRCSGLAGGSLHLSTSGVGREELLENLAGQGRVSLRNVEFRGWDVGASVADGAAHTGVSHWSYGSGGFSLAKRQLVLDNLRLDGGDLWTFVNGSVDFTRELQLLIKTADGKRPQLRTPIAGRTLKVSGSLDAPLVTIDGPDTARAAGAGIGSLP
jgi:uncharacterized protein involved in outer membrane biogenesis